MRLIAWRGWKNWRCLESEEFEMAEADLFKRRQEKMEMKKERRNQECDVATISLSAVFDCGLVTASQTLKDRGKDC